MAPEAARAAACCCTLSFAYSLMQVLGISGTTTELCLLDRILDSVGSLRRAWLCEYGTLAKTWWSAGLSVRAEGMEEKCLLDSLVMI